MRVLSLLVLALALVAVVAATAPAQANFDRASDPFMRLTQKLDSSLVETSAKATVAAASQLGVTDDDSEESSEDDDSEESTEESSDEDDSEESSDEDDSEESSEDGDDEESSDDDSEDSGSDGSEDSDDSEVDDLKSEVNSDKVKIAEDKAKIDEANARADAAEKDAATKNTLNDAKNAADLAAVRAQAEAQAKQTIQAATAQAKQLIEAAKAKGSDCGSKCGGSESSESSSSEWRDVVILKGNGANPELDNKKLGIAPVMSVDTPTIRHAATVLKKAEDFHDKFIDKHEKDCQGSICPLMNFKVGAK